MDTPETVPVLLPLALEAPYDYLVPEGESLRPGDFVAVPLGPRERIGVVWEGASVEGRPPVAPAKLRPVSGKLDLPPLPAVSMAFAEWVANYTLAPPGMVLRMMMSAREAFVPPKPYFGVRRVGAEPARMTAARTRVLEVMDGGLLWAKPALAEAAGVSTSVINGLVDAGTLAIEVMPEAPLPLPDPACARPALSTDQAEAARELVRIAGAESFAVVLLDGVTGSGKTEVYFEGIAAALEREVQILILLPEIALTSQFLDRFEARFGVRPAEWHSEMTPARRAKVWRAVARGEARVVVGARSALFLPFPHLGLIIVDEEHDQAFKQQDRVSYHARDMAVVRGSLGRHGVILSSATPSVESLVNARQERYVPIELASRYSGAALPDIEAIDLRKHPPERGKWLSPPLVSAVTETLEAGQQALLFLNRRGYAPLTLCRKCGYRFECPQCSAWLVEHRFRGRLQCHHCGFSAPAPSECPDCAGEDTLVPCGPGVERVAEEVAGRFPEARIALLSSDVTPNVAAMRQVLESIEQGHCDLVIGTQLVAKGHHFPGLAIVGVVDGDLGLGQGDPRASERTYQLLHQVTGRAGREAITGKGYIQTHIPEHPVVRALASGDRDGFLAQEIAARESAGYPPFGRLAALIISAANREAAQGYGRLLVSRAPRADKVTVLGPADAPLAVIRGRHRARVLVKAARETDIQAYLRQWLSATPDPKGSVRLAVDVDPYNFM